jgi:hypothetical protein
MKIEDERDTSEEDDSLDLDIDEDGDMFDVGESEEEEEEEVEEVEMEEEEEVEMEEVAGEALGYVEAQRKIRNKGVHQRLRNDLIEHMWSKFGEQFTL